MTLVAPPGDRFGNPFADGLPYARGAVLRGTDDDLAKLRAAWRFVERRQQEGTLYDLTGLTRSLDLGDTPPATLDDELAPALYGERLRELGLAHLGGDPERDDVFVANRLTAGVVAAMQVLVGQGSTVVGVSAGYSHPCIGRAVRLAGGELVDAVGRDEYERRLAAADDVSAVVLTRLAVTYEALAGEELAPIVAAAHERGVPVVVDDAGGARVGPAVLGQPRTLELGAELGATGLDKYGTTGPRLGLLAGRRELVARVRARATELGLEARPMLWPAVVRSLEAYSEERVRVLVAATAEAADALEGRLGGRVTRTPVAVKLEGEDVLAEAMARAGLAEPPCVPLEATAALAMALLRDHGVLTVHFAALPPGTAALLLKFLPPETLARIGGPERLAAAVDESLDEVARALREPRMLRELLGAA